MGSLTAPPSTENVRWYVMKEATEITAGQTAESTNHAGTMMHRDFYLMLCQGYKESMDS